MKARTISIFLLLGVILLIPSPAYADGIIIPTPPGCEICPPPPCPALTACPPPRNMEQLIIHYHKVTVNIQDQVAVTHVDQAFHNPNGWAVEGEYLFPLPRGAAVTSFTLRVDGKLVEGQALDAEQARQKYRQIVNELRDPALLEYAGRGAVQVHLFPIPPQGERRIELEYSQVLSSENGLVSYIYPLSTEKFSLQPLEQVSVSIDIRSSTPIQAVYSPSQDFRITRESDTHVYASYEASQVTPDTNLALDYSLGKEEALHLLSYRDLTDLSDPDGFFLLLLDPRPEVSSQPTPKDLILVLDQSGSMEGEKFRQAQAALTYILQHLNPEDRFNVVAFSTDVQSYAKRLRPAAESVDAIHWVKSLSAQGSTDINRALLEAAANASDERPTYLIFLTDGLPTEGVVKSQPILENLALAAPKNLRLFAFGVGYDVDTFLLDSLAQAHHGTSSYVPPGGRLDELISSFYAKISAPVLTDLTLDFGSTVVSDLYPSPLPDLFSGSQIMLVGRYHQAGRETIRLKGEINGQSQTLEFPDQVFTESSAGQFPESVLPRLWATRKIGALLSQIRLKGADKETIAQIVHLSIRYGIVTPYTSYLVSEPMPLGAEAQDRITSQEFGKIQAQPPAPAFGQAAVERAAEEGSLAQAEAPAAPFQETGNQIRIAGAHAFIFDGEKWIDTAFDPQQMQVVKIEFLSDEYFALAEARPELASAFALGPAVIVLSEGFAYQVAPSTAPATPLSMAVMSPTASIEPTALTRPSTLIATRTATIPPNSSPAPVHTSVPKAAKVFPPAVSSSPDSKSSSSTPCLSGFLPLLWLLAVLSCLHLKRH